MECKKCGDNRWQHVGFVGQSRFYQCISCGRCCSSEQLDFDLFDDQARKARLEMIQDFLDKGENVDDLIV